MAHPLAIFRFSEGLRFSSGIGTLGGLCVVGYGIYTYAYYNYLNTKAEKEAAQAGSGSSSSSGGSGGANGGSNGGGS